MPSSSWKEKGLVVAENESENELAVVDGVKGAAGGAQGKA